MRKGLLHILNRLLDPKALVLMYHRIATPAADIWGIAVSPENFEQHLKLLRNRGNVVPLRDLVKDVKQGKVRRNSIAITFDDGYTDNFTVARPLLEKYQLPATFFITSGNIGKEEEFWWDELEHILLFAPQLPQIFMAKLSDSPFTFDLQAEASLTEELQQHHRRWDASNDAPPTLRARLFFLLWQQLKPLPQPEQETQMQIIREWAGVPVSARPGYICMAPTQLQELSQHKLFDVGAHTVSHAALGMHNLAVQQKELLDSRQFLSALTGADIPLLAYPYGNYNNWTLEAAANTGFAAAVTTEEKAVTRRSGAYRLGRVQVKNMSGQAFAAQLQQWQRKP
ncbi:hypothetical protein GCM10023188_45370 [Pontibacter saemangeumensis]|uniref:NodB homology domain-containing protein n=1 Tax=Pontibacter saemangeumensis TaxID=1084525 RepID=A0ABP8M3T9_9BACT